MQNSGEPVSTKNTITGSLMVAVTENKKARLTTDADILNALKFSFGDRAASPRDSSFPAL